MSSKGIDDSEDDFVNKGDGFYPATVGHDDDDDDDDHDDDNDDDVYVSEEDEGVSDEGLSDNDDDLDGNDRKGRVISRLQPEQESTEGTGEGRRRPRLSVNRRMKKGATLSTDSLLQGDFGRTLREQRRAKTKNDGGAQVSKGDPDSDGGVSDHSDLDGSGRKGRVVSRLQPSNDDAADSDLSDGSDDMDGDNRKQRVVSRLRSNDVDENAKNVPERRAPRPRVSFNRKIKKGATLSTDSLLQGDFGRALREQRGEKTRKSPEVRNDANDSDGTLSDHSDLEGDKNKPTIEMHIESNDELDDMDAGENRPRPRRRLSPGRKIKKGSTLSTDSLMQGEFGRGLREQRRQKGQKEDNEIQRSPRRSAKQNDKESSPVQYHRIVEISKTDAVWKAAKNRPTRRLSTRSIDDPLPDELDVPLDEGRQTRQSMFRPSQGKLIPDGLVIDDDSEG